MEKATISEWKALLESKDGASKHLLQYVSQNELHSIILDSLTEDEKDDIDEVNTLVSTHKATKTCEGRPTW